MRADAPGHGVERQLAAANREQSIHQGRRLLHFTAECRCETVVVTPSWSRRLRKHRRIECAL
jgi:hypothetical protein